MTIPENEIDFRKKINHKNKLKFEIKQKKQILAKLIMHPECLEEVLILKSEIESLEKELKLIA